MYCTVPSISYEKSAVLDDISSRELVIELLGADGVRKITKRTKPTLQLFSECYTMLSTCRPVQQVYENKMVLEKFGQIIGEFPIIPELAIQFIFLYNKRKASTRARNLYILKGFYRYSRRKMASMGNLNLTIIKIYCPEPTRSLIW